MVRSPLTYKYNKEPPKIVQVIIKAPRLSFTSVLLGTKRMGGPLNRGPFLDPYSKSIVLCRGRKKRP